MDNFVEIKFKCKELKNIETEEIKEKHRENQVTDVTIP